MGAGRGMGKWGVGWHARTRVIGARGGGGAGMTGMEGLVVSG